MSISKKEVNKVLLCIIIFLLYANKFWYLYVPN